MSVNAVIGVANLSLPRLVGSTLISTAPVWQSPAARWGMAEVGSAGWRCCSNTLVQARQSPAS